MDSFLLCGLLVFAIGLGARDQMLVAHLSSALEQSPLLLALGCLCAFISAGLMAFAGAAMAEILPPRAADMLVAFALGVAALELFWPVRMKPMEEPTRSFGAIGIVLLARQMGDASRFIVFAFAAEAVFPVVVFVGGGLGGAAAIGLGWMVGIQLDNKVPMRTVRIAFGCCLIIAALLIGLNARYMFL